MVTNDAKLDATERLREALDERGRRQPGTIEFDRAQGEVDRLVVEFVELGPAQEGTVTGGEESIDADRTSD